MSHVTHRSDMSLYSPTSMSQILRNKWNGLIDVGLYRDMSDWCVTWLILWCVTWLILWCVTWLIDVWHDSLMCDMTHSLMCDMTHSLSPSLTRPALRLRTSETGSNRLCPPVCNDTSSNQIEMQMLSTCVYICARTYVPQLHTHATYMSSLHIRLFCGNMGCFLKNILLFGWKKIWHQYWWCKNTSLYKIYYSTKYITIHSTSLLVTIGMYKIHDYTKYITIGRVARRCSPAWALIQSWHTCDWVMARVWMSHATHMNEWC